MIGTSMGTSTLHTDGSSRPQQCARGISPCLRVQSVNVMLALSSGKTCTSTAKKALATMLDLPLAKPQEAPAAVARELPARRGSQTSVCHRTKHTSRCTGINTSVTWRHGGRVGLPIL